MTSNPRSQRWLFWSGVNSLTLIWCIALLSSLLTVRGNKEPGMVDVKIYDHRAYHDPKDRIGTGPWHFKGHGFGVNYQTNPDLTYQRERGYSYIQAYGREFCKPGKVCRPPDPNFFQGKLFNDGQLYYGPVISDARVRHSLDTPTHHPTNEQVAQLDHSPHSLPPMPYDR